MLICVLLFNDCFECNIFILKQDFQAWHFVGASFSFSENEVLCCTFSGTYHWDVLYLYTCDLFLKDVDFEPLVTVLHLRYSM